MAKQVEESVEHIGSKETQSINNIGPRKQGTEQINVIDATIAHKIPEKGNLREKGEDWKTSVKRFTYQEIDHVSRECPKRISMKCTNCGKLGHTIEKCFKPKNL